MRIRKGLQVRRGNPSALRESQSSDAHGARRSQSQHDKSDEFVYVDERSRSSAAETCENIPERVVVRSEAPPSWLAALQTIAKVSPTAIDRPYMNLDEFVNSLARENCFPEDSEFINHHCDHHHKTGQSSGLITNFSEPSDGQFIRHWSSIKAADDVDTSLRLAISPREEMAPATDPSSRMQSRVSIVVNTEEVVAGTTTEREARAASILEAGQNIIAHAEVYGQSYHMVPTSAILETTEVEVEAGQRNQTMEPSTESMERRPRRLPRSTGREKGRLPSPAATNEEQTDEASSSDYSLRRFQSRKRKRKRTLVSVSSSTLATQDGERKKQKPGLRSTGAGKSASKGTKTKKEPKASNSRSGRPKRLQYMKQENAEKLGNQCNRSDGKGWTCPLLANAGYQLCDHHLDKLRCKPGSRSKYKKKKGAATLS